MVLNGLGFSNRQLYLVPQYFENKPVEHLLGEGITADMLNDDCLGRTLDWIAEHDPTALFAGIAQQARQRFELASSRVHVDPTSFSVSGAYERDLEAGEPAQIAITYGYSRDHREDLKQWMLAKVPTHDGDVPLFMRPLDGNSCDKASISRVVQQVIEHLRESSPAAQEEPLGVFDSGGYSQANMKAYNEAKIRWCSRVPETSVEAKAALAQQPDQWKEFSDHSGHYVRLQQSLPKARRTLDDDPHEARLGRGFQELAKEGEQSPCYLAETALASLRPIVRL